MQLHDTILTFEERLNAIAAYVHLLSTTDLLVRNKVSRRNYKMWRECGWTLIVLMNCTPSFGWEIDRVGKRRWRCYVLDNRNLFRNLEWRDGIWTQNKRWWMIWYLLSSRCGADFRIRGWERWKIRTVVWQRVSNISAWLKNQRYSLSFMQMCLQGVDDDIRGDKEIVWRSDYTHLTTSKQDYISKVILSFSIQVNQ